MKKGIAIVIVGLLIIAIGIGTYNIFDKTNKNTKEIDTNEKQNTKENNENKNVTTSKKMLVVYFSAQNHTEAVAKKVASNLNADIFKIEPIMEYTSDDLNWSNENSRVSREHNDPSLRNIELKTSTVANWDSYDTILIGYPIWWGEAAWPVNNFVKDNDFTNKTVIPFCTSASSSLGNSAKLLEEMTKTGNWESGHRFSSSATDADIKKWTDNLVK